MPPSSPLQPPPILSKAVRPPPSLAPLSRPGTSPSLRHTAPWSYLRLFLSAPKQNVSSARAATVPLPERGTCHLVPRAMPLLNNRERTNERCETLDQLMSLSLSVLFCSVGRGNNCPSSPAVVRTNPGVVCGSTSPAITLSGVHGAVPGTRTGPLLRAEKGPACHWKGPMAPKDPP